VLFLGNVFGRIWTTVSLLFPPPLPLPAQLPIPFASRARWERIVEAQIFDRRRVEAAGRNLISGNGCRAPGATLQHSLDGSVRRS